MARRTRPATRRRRPRDTDAWWIVLGVAFVLVMAILGLWAEGRRLEAVGIAAVIIALALVATKSGRGLIRRGIQWRRRRVYTQRRRREQVPAGLRFKVFQRDGFRCTYCGRAGAGADLHADHVVPVALGGRTTIDNLVTACRDCNLGKSARAVV